MTFSFTATARCGACGEFLGESDAECDHDGKTVSKHTFRKIGGDRESLQGVVATGSWKWFALKDKLGDDWIDYEYMGTKETLNAMVTGNVFDSVENIPYICMSVDAPLDVKGYKEDDDE